jgi:cellulose synthase/poly-beta-1,6-N-acetylglucosamine synthase-like glycosyltransferase
MFRRGFIVRFWEIFPGTLTWITLIGAPVLAFFHPVWISVYVIIFDCYWFFKGANIAIHLLWSYRLLKLHQKVDWLSVLQKCMTKEQMIEYFQKILLESNPSLKKLCTLELERLSDLSRPIIDWQRIYHVILVPTVKESLEVLSESIDSYAQASYPREKMFFILATEERAGENTRITAKKLQDKYQDKFGKFFWIEHPDGLPGEIVGKGANVTYAASAVKGKLVELQIPFEDVIISTFDADTVVEKSYFSHLTYDFLTEQKPLQRSYQPIPMYHNNIWDTPAIARVIAISSSFWQMVEASRPDRLITFSSHAMSYKTLVDVGFWRKDIVPEDSHIFWQCFLHFNGDYKTKPLFSTVSMDAVLGDNYWGTMVAQYKQKRRWAWGVTEMSLVFPQLFANKKIPLWKRFIYSERLVEGHYFWATASIMIAILGWLPLIFGGNRFGDTVLAVNLPQLTKWIMSTATFFLIFSIYINIVQLPPRPKGHSKIKNFFMVIQWVFSPIVSTVFGSMPAIDAQTRLLFGKYMGFWVTPKVRKQNN